MAAAAAATTTGPWWMFVIVGMFIAMPFGLLFLLFDLIKTLETDYFLDLFPSVRTMLSGDGWGAGGTTPTRTQMLIGLIVYVDLKRCGFGFLTCLVFIVYGASASCTLIRYASSKTKRDRLTRSCVTKKLLDCAFVHALMTGTIVANEPRFKDCPSEPASLVLLALLFGNSAFSSGLLAGTTATYIVVKNRRHNFATTYGAYVLYFIGLLHSIISPNPLVTSVCLVTFAIITACVVLYDAIVKAIAKVCRPPPPPTTTTTTTTTEKAEDAELFSRGGGGGEGEGEDRGVKRRSFCAATTFLLAFGTYTTFPLNMYDDDEDPRLSLEPPLYIGMFHMMAVTFSRLIHWIAPATHLNQKMLMGILLIRLIANVQINIVLGYDGLVYLCLWIALSDGFILHQLLKRATTHQQQLTHLFGYVLGLAVAGLLSCPIHVARRLASSDLNGCLPLIQWTLPPPPSKV